MATQEVDDEVAKIQQKMTDDFVTWIPNNIKSSIIVECLGLLLQILLTLNVYIV